MSRPKHNRKIRHLPLVKGFKPFGVPYAFNEKIYILPEEYEAMKLIDYDGYTQEEAAVFMNISRPVVTRIYQSCREKIAKSIVENKTIIFETLDNSSNVEYVKEYYCHDCKNFFDIPHDEEVKHCIYCGSENITLKNKTTMKAINFESGFGRGGGRGYGYGRGGGRGRGFHSHHHHDDNHLHMGAEGYCICVKCGTRYEHIPGVPCRERRCEKCGTALVREGSEHHRLILEKLKRKENNNKQNDNE